MFRIISFSISIILITSSIFCFLFHRKNILLLLISLELIYLSATINFVVFSKILDDFLGEVYVLLIFTVSAAETSIGLGLLILFFRMRGGISSKFIKYLKC